MILCRGDIAYVAIKEPYTGKPRPVVVIQADEATPFRDSVTVCPLTGALIDAPVIRVRIAPTSGNGSIDLLTPWRIRSSQCRSPH